MAKPTTLRFLADGDLDRVLGVVLELAGEVYVLRERLALLERLLDEQGCVTRADLQGHQATPEERTARLAGRDRFIERILAPMTSQPESPTPDHQPA